MKAIAQKAAFVALLLACLITKSQSLHIPLNQANDDLLSLRDGAQDDKEPGTKLTPVALVAVPAAFIYLRYPLSRHLKVIRFLVSGFTFLVGEFIAQVWENRNEDHELLQSRLVAASVVGTLYFGPLGTNSLFSGNSENFLNGLGLNIGSIDVHNIALFPLAMIVWDDLIFATITDGLFAGAFVAGMMVVRKTAFKPRKFYRAYQACAFEICLVAFLVRILSVLHGIRDTMWSAMVRDIFLAAYISYKTSKALEHKTASNAM